MQHFIWSCSTFLPSTIKIFQRVFELQSGHEIFLIKQRVITPKVRKPELSILYAIHVLIYISTKYHKKYSKGYSSYKGDKKFYANADTNGIRPKNNMSPMVKVIPVIRKTKAHRGAIRLNIVYIFFIYIQTNLFNRLHQEKLCLRHYENMPIQIY